MRVLLVGGIRQRLHQGPVDWAGHRFEMIPHQFHRVVHFELEHPERGVEVDPDLLDEFVSATSGHGAVFCESPEAVILLTEWRRRNIEPRPLVALEVHGLVRVEAMRRWYMGRGEEDPWLAAVAAPGIAWIAASTQQAKRLEEEGVARDRIHPILGSTGTYSLFMPDADAILDGGPEGDESLAEGLPVDGVVVAGTGRRDPETLLRAASELQGIPIQVIDEEHEEHRQRVEALGLGDQPGVTWLKPEPLERYIALIRRARLVVVALLEGSGDGGHISVSTAQRLGVPVVCSDVPGIVDYVDDDRSARLVPPGDPLALAAAVRALWEDPATRARLARGGRLSEGARVKVFQDSFLRALASAARGAHPSLKTEAGP